MTLETLLLERPDPDADGSHPLNWWRDDECADGEAIAGRVLAVLTTTLGFDERATVTIDVFGADRPCEACFWGA